jgi:hypothetical protein
MEFVKDAAELRERMALPEQRALLDYWLELRGRARMPARRDILPERIPRWLLPHLGLIDVLPEGCFRYRLIGTAMVAFYGRDYTGLLVEQGKARDYAAALNGLYALCARERAPVHAASRLLYRMGETRLMHRLLLPLSADGERVDMLLFSTMPAHALREAESLRAPHGDEAVAIDPRFEPAVAAA